MKWLLLFLAFTSTLTAEIRELRTLDPLAEELKRCHEKDLVLLDIGGTLLMPRDAVLQPVHEAWKKEWFARNYPNITRSEMISYVLVVHQEESGWELANAEWPKLITEAQARGIRVAAFTKLYIDPSLRGFCTKHLQLCGISLRDALPELACGSSFEYAAGVIQTDAKLKGPVLAEVLSKLPEHPKRILFVDDRLEQLQSVESTCDSLLIPYIGFHFKAQHAAAPLHPEVADKQLRTLVTEHRWIPDAKAKS